MIPYAEIQADSKLLRFNVKIKSWVKHLQKPGFEKVEKNFAEGYLLKLCRCYELMDREFALS